MKKEKPPAFQFYVKDWLGDPALRMASPAVRGTWIDFICYMWMNDRSGELTGTGEELARMVGISIAEFDEFLAEIKRLKIAGVTETNGNVTLTNRRMSREANTRDQNRLRQQKRRGNGKGNAKVTPPSSSSPSTTVSKELVLDTTQQAQKPSSPERSPPSHIPSDAINILHGIWQATCGSKSGMIAQETLDGLDRAAIAGALRQESDVGVLGAAVRLYAEIRNGPEYVLETSWTLKNFFDKGHWRKFVAAGEYDPRRNYLRRDAVPMVEDLPGLKKEIAAARETEAYWRDQIERFGDKDERWEKVYEAEACIERLDLQIRAIELKMKV